MYNLSHKECIGIRQSEWGRRQRNIAFTSKEIAGGEGAGIGALIWSASQGPGV
jgi:hypothetical protein